MKPDVERIAAAVQENCDISDAGFAQDMTLCNYLLAMREYFRWERGLAAGTPPDRAQVGEWIAGREARWRALEGRAYGPLPLAEQAMDPFAVEAINARLVPAGWAYGAAIGRFGKPHFFLGRLEKRSVREGVEVLEVGREVARDIEAAPASLAGATVVLRLEAFERWLWTSAETWDRSRDTGAMRAALASYGYEHDRAGAIARMLDEQRETLLLHEMGEHAAGLALGDDWERFMDRLQDRRVEILARAVRDLLADCLVTLPAIAASRSEASAHFWFATFGGMRRALFPRLASAYDRLREQADWSALETASREGREHWNRIAGRLAGEEAGAELGAAAFANPAGIALA